MTARLPEVDVALVGLGAACGVAAHVLTDAGLAVAALEAGPRHGAEDAANDEIRNDMRAMLAQPKALHELPTWRTDEAEVAGPTPWPILMINGVGGASLHYEGLSIRFHPWNFESRTRVLERYGASAIPRNSTIADWPISYEDLEPYYGLVERAIGVSGQAGNLAGDIDPAGNALEAPRREPYPMPPLRSTGWSEHMADAARSLGWHPFPAPAAINSVPYDGRQECTYCGFCQYNTCYRDAKGSTNLNVIRRAEATGRLRIETWARVLRVETDRDGLVTGVTFARDGQEYFQPAQAVLLGTFIYENTRLLLLSRSKAHPNGLSNGSDQVGKHYIAHLTPSVFGLFPDRQLKLFSGNGSQVTCVDDYNADYFDHSGEGFIGGGMLTAAQEMAPISFARRVTPPTVPRWGREWKAWLAKNAQSAGVVYCQFDALPYETNSLDLDPSVTDRHGVPVVRVTHRLFDNEHRGVSFIQGVLRRWLTGGGATETWQERPTIEGRHCYGGTRMGDDPETSVVDGYGLSHEVPNLGMLGASTFPSAGGGNPTLTVQAAAWRTAERVVERWRDIAPKG